MTMEDAATKRGTPPRFNTPPSPVAASMLRIWDPFVRVFHWLLAIGFAVNFFELVRPGKYPHRVIGYAILSLIAARLIWGLIGSRHARFADFVRAPGEIFDHLRTILRNRDRRYLGHNPAGGAMVVLLLLNTFAVGGTGWLSRTHWFFGVKWMENLHGALANIMLGLVILHVLGVIHASWRHRENLVLSMLTGRKRSQLAPVPLVPELSREHAPVDRRG
jgi:cytochrome b